VSNLSLPEHFDIAIVGGGLVGSSLALSLAPLGFKVALFDKIPKPVPQVPTVTLARALALSRPSISCLQTLNIWEKIKDKATPIQEVHVSSKGKFGVTVLKAAKERLSEFGFVLDADLLTRLLAEQVEAIKAATIFRPVEITALEYQQESNSYRWQIELNTGELITAKLLVAADGADSFVRKHQGIDADVHDYQQTALVANLTIKGGHQNIAYERFLDDGAIAMLPFGTSQVKSVWVLPSSEAELQLANADSEYLNNLQTLFGLRLGKFIAVGKRSSFSLKSVSAQTVYGQGFVLIGNAAHTLHPVAAQGFNLGLRDVITLTACLSTAQKNQQAISNIELLQNYANKRAEDQRLTRGFNHYLAANSPGIALGVLAAEFIPLIKKKLLDLSLGNPII
jgi:2-octaprenyl-6-methoxyphenol hydroxylase